MNLQPRDPNADIAKPGVDEEALQFFPVGHFSRRAEARGSLAVEELVERLAYCAVIDARAVPDAQREPAAGSEHSVHLAQRKLLVRKELQALLAEHHVEAAVRKAEIHGASLHPFDQDRRGERARHRKHRRIEIETGHLAGRTDALCGDARYDPGPAGDVEHPVAARDARRVDERRRPRPEEVAHHVALVELGGVAADLPLLVLHCPCHPSLREMRRAASSTAAICFCGGWAGTYCTEPAIAMAPA